MVSTSFRNCSKMAMESSAVERSGPFAMGHDLCEPRTRGKKGSHIIIPLCTNKLPINSFLFFPSFFSTGLVQLYMAGLPLRSCHTIGAPSVQGSTQCPFFSFLVAAGFEPCHYEADALTATLS